MNTSHEFNDLKEFTKIFALQPTAWKDTGRIHPEVLDLCTNLIKEEVIKETLEALQIFKQNPTLENLTWLADGLVDSVYVLLYAAAVLQLPWENLWNEVHRSNMAKRNLDGTITRRREDNKIMKPAHWTPPDLFSILMEWQEKRVLNAKAVEYRGTLGYNKAKE